MSNSEIFKTGCLSPIQWATGPKCKKKYLGPDAQGALTSELVNRYKIVEISEKYKLNCSGFYEIISITFVT